MYGYSVAPDSKTELKWKVSKMHMHYVFFLILTSVIAVH